MKKWIAREISVTRLLEFLFSILIRLVSDAPDKECLIICRSGGVGTETTLTAVCQSGEGDICALCLQKMVLDEEKRTSYADQGDAESRTCLKVTRRPVKEMALSTDSVQTQGSGCRHSRLFGKDRTPG